MVTDSSSRSRRPALGRGLSALIPAPPSTSTRVIESGGLLRLPIEKVRASHDQPRQYFDEASLAELASSIKEHGLLQPVVVRREREDYVLIAGERRWRAAQRAGLREIPAVVRDDSADDSLLLALVENLQREDLNPIEEAEAYRRLAEDGSLSQEAIAQRVGKDRTTVANAMRLLRLPASVRQQVQEGELGMGHARALLALEDPASMERLAREVVRKKLSVRDVERRVKLFKAGSPAARTAPVSPTMSPALRDLTDRLVRALGTRVVVKEKGRGAGSIEIAYSSLDELDRLLGLMCR
ncbi:MAG: ParB/RepB/Spo0J family partition protein [Pseudomonadota bacterium]